jgi:hypothetical protein
MYGQWKDRWVPTELSVIVSLLLFDIFLSTCASVYTLSLTVLTIHPIFQ